MRPRYCWTFPYSDPSASQGSRVKEECLRPLHDMFHRTSGACTLQGGWWGTYGEILRREGRLAVAVVLVGQRADETRGSHPQSPSALLAHIHRLQRLGVTLKAACQRPRETTSMTTRPRLPPRSGGLSYASTVAVIKVQLDDSLIQGAVTSHLQ